jgi:hypothetical protein
MLSSASRIVIITFVQKNTMVMIELFPFFKFSSVQFIGKSQLAEIKGA